MPSPSKSSSHCGRREHVALAARSSRRTALDSVAADTDAVPAFRTANVVRVRPSVSKPPYTLLRARFHSGVPRFSNASLKEVIVCVEISVEQDDVHLRQLLLAAPSCHHP